MPESRPKATARVPALLAASTFGLLLIWPLVAGMAAAHDDIFQLLVHYDSGGLGGALLRSWREPLFRPLVSVSGWLSDPVTRAAPAVMVVQGALLVAAAIALELLARSLPGREVPRGLVAALWLLHPATSVSVWQIDTTSQTGSAAAGLWLTALAAGAWRPRVPAAAWPLIVVLGVLSKETFLGWLPVALWFVWARRRSLARGELFGLAAALLVCSMFLLGRLWVLHNGAPIAHAAYALRVGPQTLRNLAVLLAGGLAVGPIHALNVLTPRDPSWWLCLLGSALHLAALAFAAGTASERRVIASSWALAMLATLPVLFMGHISELYLMGPNALIAIALGDSLVFAAARLPAVWFRGAAAALLVCALAGVASRAYHFALTWRYSRELAAQAERLASPHTQPVVRRECMADMRRHSVYVASPIEALNPMRTRQLIEARGGALAPNWVTGLDCAALPRRRAF